MTRLQEVEQLLDSNLQLISDYSKRIATLMGSVRQLEKERDKLMKKNRGIEIVRCKDCNEELKAENKKLKAENQQMHDQINRCIEAIKDFEEGLTND